MGSLCFPLQILYQQELSFYKSDFNIMKQINLLIWECLAIDPHRRPSIQFILERDLFKEQQSIDKCVQNMAQHVDVVGFYQECIEPFFDSARKGAYIEDSCVKGLRNIKKRAKELCNSSKMAAKYVIPKQYPWPRRVEGSFSKQLQDNK